MSEQTYILDSNVFIQACDMTYCHNIFPGFWDWLNYEIQRKKFVVIEDVYSELSQKGYVISQWMETQKKHIVKTDSVEFQRSLKSVLSKAGDIMISGSHYTENAQNDFAEKADSRIIAYAHSSGGVVVTNEVKDNVTKRVKIPWICHELQIKCINLHALLLSINPVFHWSKEAYSK